MFDIGFTELLLIGVVALVVVGPEKLPGLVKTTLSYIRQFKASFSTIRNEVERELALDELKDDIAQSKSAVNQSIGYDELKESLEEIRDEAKHLKDDRYFDGVSEAEIEADLDDLVRNSGPQLPAADTHADTGVEILDNPKSNTPQGSVQDNIQDDANSVLTENDSPNSESAKRVKS